MILPQLGMLCIANNRTDYYLRALLKKNILPAVIILMVNRTENLTQGQKKLSIDDDLMQSIRTHDVELIEVDTIDVNDVLVINVLKERSEIYFIYSGPGGSILKTDILSLGKEFLHIHPGKVPEYRGSTTIYYQILNEKKVWASAIFLKQKIDTGPLIIIKQFELPYAGEDWDYDYDPRIRAELLAEVIESYAMTGQFEFKNQAPHEGSTYYIAHPVIRHLARLYAQQDPSK